MADIGVSANRLELLQIADAVAREKSIDKSVVLACDGGGDPAGRQGALWRGERNPSPRSIRAPARLVCNRLLLVVEKVRERRHARSASSRPSARNPAASIGDQIAEPLPPIEFGRIAAQNAKQVIVQKVRDAERDRMYDEYKDRIGEIVHGAVKRVEYGNVIVDLGRGEGIIRRDESLPRETFKPGDRVRAYVYDVRREQRGPQIFLSRTHPEFMARLFGQEVPEIYDGVVEVVAVARDPGSRAKIAVRSKDGSIDPVGACVGMRGSRVQAVVNELQGEKIDIIQWTPDVASFVVNALAPAEVSKVVLDEEAERIEVVVPDEQLSLAIGRRGQNVRLASQLYRLGHRHHDGSRGIGAPSEGIRRPGPSSSSMRSTWTRRWRSCWPPRASPRWTKWPMSTSARSPRSMASTSRRRKSCRTVPASISTGPPGAGRQRRVELGVLDELKEIEGVTPQMLVALGEADIKSIEDLAGCATDDLIGWTERKAGRTTKHKGAFSELEISADEANALIMQARVRAGWIEAPAEEPAPEEVVAEAEAEAQS